MGVIAHRFPTSALKINKLVIDIAQLVVVLIEAYLGQSPNSLLVDPSLEDSDNDLDEDRGCSRFGSFISHHPLHGGPSGAMWKTMTGEWFDDGRTFLEGSNGLLYGVKESITDEGPISEKISLGKIDGQGKQQQQKQIESLATVAWPQIAVAVATHAPPWPVSKPTA